MKQHLIGKITKKNTVMRQSGGRDSPLATPLRTLLLYL